jgi:asparagine synthase (glutamine-hydrolysing)
MIGLSGLAGPAALDASERAACERSHQRICHIPDQRHTALSPDPAVMLCLLETGVYGGVAAQELVTVAVAGCVDEGGAAPGGDAAAVLGAYMRGGVDAVAAMRGSFFAVLLDHRRRKLFLVTDRFAQRPHYYWTDGRRLAWGSEMKFLLGLPFVGSELNPLAVTEYFRFQTVLGDRTFFRDIQVIPQATWIEYDLVQGAVTIRRYWNYGDFPDRPAVLYAEAVRTAAGLFEQSMQRALKRPFRYGALLSGGLDSRLIADQATQAGHPLATFTFGFPGCRDQLYARKIAARIGSRHTAMPWTDGKWLREWADTHTALTECFHCLFHSHGLSFCPEIARQIDVNLSGCGGDLMMGGGFLMPEVLARRGDWAFAEDSLHAFLRDSHGRSVRRDADEALLFEPEFLARREMGVREGFREVFRTFLCARPEIATDCFHMSHRDRRMIQYFLVFSRPYFESQTPFFDFDLLDYLYSLPPEFRIGRRLQIDLSDLLAPRSMRVPWQKTGAVPSRRRGWEKSWNELKLGLAWRAEKISRGRIGPPRYGYADYAGWIRADLRDWIEDVLFSPRAASREVFRTEGIRSCWDAHLAGTADHTYVIGMLISYELLLQQARAMRDGPAALS